MPTPGGPAGPSRSDESHTAALPFRRLWWGDNVVLAGIHVLVVEDQPDSLGTLRTKLCLQGATVECADSAAAAREAALRRRPDVLVSDLRLTGDGARLAIEIGMPSIACASDSAAELQARDAGFYRFFLKPAPPRLLLAAVCDLVDRSVEAA
jgi:DNA-binding response OmpR family regulator